MSQSLKITKVETFLCKPTNQTLLVVKVQTNEPGLHGLGCATFTQRSATVRDLIRDYISPFVIGKNPHDIEDIFQGAMVSGYWRNGPELGNAISGIDMALWDIKGKLANMPCYQLWGGKCRAAVPVYIHVSGKDNQELADKIKKQQEKGFRYFRCNRGDFLPTYKDPKIHSPESVLPGSYYDPRRRMKEIPKVFEYLRSHLPSDVELIYDSHERLAPIDAVELAKALEEFHLFFVEDLFAPEDSGWLEQVRRVCTTPMAMGELFNNPNEWMHLISQRWIDFIRVHISQIGGISPALKLAHTCQSFGIRTAWHGPLDLSPVGAAANLHLDLAVPNCAIQEWALGRSSLEEEMFPGIPTVKDGYLYANNKPGLGIDFNETLAAKHPGTIATPPWMMARWPDGTIWRP